MRQLSESTYCWPVGGQHLHLEIIKGEIVGALPCNSAPHPSAFIPERVPTVLRLLSALSVWEQREARISLVERFGLDVQV